MMFLVLLIALAASVWGVLLARRASLQLLAFAVLMLGTALGPYFFAIDGPIQISADRVLWGGMIALMVFRLLLGQTRPIQLNRYDWIVAGLGAWLLVSTQMGRMPEEGTPPVARWLFYYLMPMGMYVVARYSRLSRFELRIVLAGMGLFGVYLGITALAEKFGVSALVFPRYIADPKYVEFYGRGRGPLLNPTGNGFLLSLSFCAVLVGIPYCNRAGRLLSAVAAIIISGGLFATLTRSVWMAAGAGAGFTQLNRVSRRMRVLAVMGLGLAAVMLVVGLGDQLLNLKRDKNLSASASAESIELRPLLMVIAWEMFKDHPVAGVGYGHYFAYNHDYAETPGWEMPLRKASVYMQHNVLLSYLVDAGLIGCGLFCVLLISWTLKGWSIARSTSACPEARQVGLMMAATVTSYLINGMFQDVSVIPMVNMYLFYFAGLTMAVESVDGKLPERHYSDRRQSEPSLASHCATQIPTV